MRLIRAALVAAALVAGGCSLVLSDFTVADGASDDGGVDASVGTDAIAPHPNAGDAHVPDAAPDADAGAPDSGCGPDAKMCGGKCVAIDDPAFGCGAPACDPCVVAHASATCKAGACAVDQCAAGFSDCANGAADGCELPTSADPAHCGSCTNVCNAAGGTPNCAGGVCSSIACTAPHADCDQKADTGCEVDT